MKMSSSSSKQNSLERTFGSWRQAAAILVACAVLPQVSFAQSTTTTTTEEVTTATTTEEATTTTTDPCFNFDDSKCPTPPSCQEYVCEPTTGDCLLQNLPVNTACEDGYQCSMGDTCDGQGNCKAGPVPYVDSNLDVTYSGNPGDLEVYFAENNENKPYNIGLTFGYETYNPDGEPIPPEFAAIIFAGKCGDPAAAILADYATGSIEPDYASSYQTLGTPVFDLLINTTEPTAPVLEISTPFINFAPPFWNQNYMCSRNDFGVSNGDTSGPDLNERCGRLQFCVEFQVILCDGKKIVFRDVNVALELDIESQCEDDQCGDVIMARAAPEDAEGSFAADFPIKCEPCKPDDPGASSLVQTVQQGEVMKACISLEQASPGACIMEIEDLDLELSGQPYQIVPECPFINCLFPATDFISYNPTDYLDDAGATVAFQPPAWWFQEVTFGTDRVTGTFAGSVILGFGCYCDGSCDAGSSRTRKLSASQRDLQQEDELKTIAFRGSSFGIDTVKTTTPTTPPEGGTCSLGTLLG